MDDYAKKYVVIYIGMLTFSLSLISYLYSIIEDNEFIYYTTAITITHVTIVFCLMFYSKRVEERNVKYR